MSKRVQNPSFQYQTPPTTLQMSELEEYKVQLQEVEESLKLDPENDSLKELQKELTDLVQLLSQSDTKEEKASIPHGLQQHPSKSLTPPAPELKYSIGDLVFVKPKLEKVHQEAKITNIAGNGKTYTIQFLETQIIETHPVEEILTERPKQDLVSKYKQQQLAKEQKKEEKKIKNQEYEQSLNKSAQSWKNFSTKKKVKKTVGSSQFKTNTHVGAMTAGKKKERNVRYNPY